MPKALSEAGKEQLAVALHLLRQWKTQEGSRFQPEVILMILELADYLEVRKQYDDMLVPLPRYQFIAQD